MTRARRALRIWTMGTCREPGFQPGPGGGSGSLHLLFLSLASRGQHPLANTVTTRPRLVVRSGSACQGLPYISSFNPQKNAVILFLQTMKWRLRG